MKQEVTAIFDIGKTNKKFFLFDASYTVVHTEHTRIEERTDEDGYPCEDLPQLETWMREVLQRVLASKAYEVRTLNISAYGASLVHLDRKGKVVTPLYNYTKPLDTDLEDAFYEEYGPESEFCARTGVFRAGMLNSGMQLYWIKHRKPDTFKKIHQSLHLPQYLSYLFTGSAVSDYTSIGCHTGLWDYDRKAYHPWVAREGILPLLPDIVTREHVVTRQLFGQSLEIGTGIHDSSAALLPYIQSQTPPFILLSTGTWNVSLNPFARELEPEERKDGDLLYYMQPDGKPVLASRVFLGHAHEVHLTHLCQVYDRPADAATNLAFDPILYKEVSQLREPVFSRDGSIEADLPREIRKVFSTFEAAYHRLILELVGLQEKSLRLAMAGEEIRRLFIEGGFATNRIFLELLSRAMPGTRILLAGSSPGAALGAALAVSGSSLPAEYFSGASAFRPYESTSAG